MLTKEEREHRIAFAQKQFEVFKMYALYWQTMAMTGHATLRNVSQGREPTEEEKALGQSIGWREKTDVEKVEDALGCMMNHIRQMTETIEQIDRLRRGEV
jgi:hypothetical protein